MKCCQACGRPYASERRMCAACLRPILRTHRWHIDGTRVFHDNCLDPEMKSIPVDQTSFVEL